MTPCLFPEFAVDVEHDDEADGGDDDQDGRTDLTHLEPFELPSGEVARGVSPKLSTLLCAGTARLTRSHLSLPPPRSGWRPGQVDHLGAAARSWMSTCTRIARGRDRRRDRPIVREHFGLANCATSARCESGGTAAGELRATSTAVSNMMGCCRCQRATAELAATAGRAC